MNLARLKNELYDIQNDPPPFCYAAPRNDEDFLHWNAMIIGPPECPYSGAALFLKIILTDYPNKPPKIFFIKPIYHLNVGENGSICMDILTTATYWSPAYSISKILICITSILSDPLMEGRPLNLNAAEMYRIDRARYYKLAKESCKNQCLVPEFQKFYHQFGFVLFGNMNKKLLKYEIKENKIISADDLCYPHDKLDEIFEMAEKDSDTFISPKIIKAYKTARNSYSLIKMAENNIKKWAEEILKCESVEFLEDNFQYRISCDLQNKELWKYYFKYLKENNVEKLLQMYSYYCRFFPDDKDIFDEYEKAVKEFKYIFFPFVSWKNPFKFEIFDENVETPKEPIIQPVESTSTKQPITCYFTANTISTPNYPFRSPLMNYILQNSSPEILQKLYETCKYYFQNLPTPFWYKLEITNDEKKFAQYKKYSAKFGLQRFEDSFFENIHLSTVLSVKRSTDNLTLSKCLPKLFKCDAKYISISSQDLTEMEFKFLIESKRVIEIELENTYIFDENGEGIMLEEILKLTPKIKRFRLDIVQCNSETSKIISELPFENKIEAFQLNNIPDESLVAIDFAEFITKNAAVNGVFSLQFEFDVDNFYKHNFKEIVKNHLREIWSDNQKPNVEIF